MSQIGRGLMVLVGITHEDTPDDIEYIANKILMLKLFEDDSQKHWSHSVTQRNFEVLSVSQVGFFFLLLVIITLPVLRMQHLYSIGPSFC